MASDTDRIARYRYHGRIAFFPLAGGAAGAPAGPARRCPLALDQYVPAGGGQPAPGSCPAAYDGSTTGSLRPPRSPTPPALGGPRAAFTAGGTLYTAHTDGTLRARSFDGTTLGAPHHRRPPRLTAFASDLAT